MTENKKIKNSSFGNGEGNLKMTEYLEAQLSGKGTGVRFFHWIVLQGLSLSSRHASPCPLS